MNRLPELKTTLDAVDVIYDMLDSINLRSIISGDLYKYDSRPADSEKEDIVVNAITVAEGLIQNGVCNVNIHVPDLKKTNGNALYDVPDEDRLKTILNKVVECLGKNHGRSFKNGNSYISNISNPIKEPELHEHFINVRINIEFHNQLNR